MILKNFKNKLLLILLIAIISIPNLTFAYSNNVILGGENVGIEVNSPGVLVIGFYDIDGTSPGKKAGLKVGDLIVKVDDTVIHGITDLSKNIKSKKATITYKRNKSLNTTNIILKEEGNIYKTGLYVKDSIVGIGTLTFIDPATKRFGALGHEILEQTSGTKFEIDKGKIFSSNVVSIKKGNRGEVGEKEATYNLKDIYGKIDKNDITGIYGDYSKNNNSNTIPVASAKVGKASIVTVVKGKKKEYFDINISHTDSSDNIRNILFEVTDNKLLEEGNGIVQGMSGSPIVQDNKLVGAVTHVVVDDPHKGYGIFINNMLKESEEG